MRRSILVYAAVLVAGCTIQGDPPLSERDAGVEDAGPVAVDAAPRDGGFFCTPGVVGCYGNIHYTCGDERDTREDEVVCPDACDPTLGCVTCVPGSRRCDGTVSMRCDDDGSGWTFGRDCSDWDVACGEGGYCEDGCASVEAQRSYVGCEYFTSPLPNYADLRNRAFDFRVVVTNPNRQPVDVTILKGAQLIVRETVVPGGVAEIPLPWINALSFPFDGQPWESFVQGEGAYRILSNHPFIVAQFNPFHYVAGRDFSHSNDASLLLPVHVLGDEYIGLSYLPLSSGVAPHVQDVLPGYLALVGVTPEPANVEIIPTVTVERDAAGRWPVTEAGTPLRFALARGEVAIVTPTMPPICSEERDGFSPITPGRPQNGGWCDEPDHDLTGSIITADRAIQAFGGHTCAFVPFDVMACDHLEETLAPLATWGTEFETMPLRDPATRAPNLLRIVAGHDGTELTLDPPQHGVDAGHRLERGEHIDVMIEGPVSIAATQPIQVGQILLGQNIENPPLERGDPALTMLVPQEQFRTEYVFVTPSSYVATTGGQSWLLVSREPGVAITLDGAPLEAEWMSAGERELALVAVAGGSHRATSSKPFGLIAYGLGSYTSYAYPAGLDLRVIPF